MARAMPSTKRANRRSKGGEDDPPPPVVPEDRKESSLNDRSRAMVVVVVVVVVYQYNDSITVEMLDVCLLLEEEGIRGYPKQATRRRARKPCKRQPLLDHVCLTRYGTIHYFTLLPYHTIPQPIPVVPNAPWEKRISSEERSQSHKPNN
eukprot:scaffold2120_cov169-Amphora_coffeaeformis.AAC.17